MLYTVIILQIYSKIIALWRFVNVLYNVWKLLFTRGGSTSKTNFQIVVS